MNRLSLFANIGIIKQIIKNKPTTMKKESKTNSIAITGLAVLILIAILLVAVSANYLIKREKTAERWLETDTATEITQPSMSEEELMGSVCKFYSSNTDTEVIDGQIFGAVTDFGMGSGFIAFEPGLIVTAYHVVKDYETFTASFSNGEFVSMGKLLAFDEENDIALLSFPNLEGKTVLQCGKTGNLKPGDELLSITSPGDELNKITRGQYLGHGVEIGLETKSKYGAKLGTAPGSSGGPVFNIDNQVIGIVLSRIDEDDIDFFVPIEYVMNVYDSWKKS